MYRNDSIDLVRNFFYTMIFSKVFVIFTSYNSFQVKIFSKWLLLTITRPEDPRSSQFNFNADMKSWTSMYFPPKILFFEFFFLRIFAIKMFLRFYLGFKNTTNFNFLFSSKIQISKFKFLAGIKNTL